MALPPATRHALLRGESKAALSSLSPAPRVILGSQSKIRRELMSELGALHGFHFTTLAPRIDEKAIRFNDPVKLVAALATAKAAALLPILEISEEASAPTLLITCDQVIEHRGRILEKPENKHEARSNITSYSKHPARTVASILCTNVTTGYACEGVDISEVYFNEFPEEVLEKLLEDDEIYHCAGGLCVEHPLVLPLVKEIVGTIDSVQGLPKALVERLMREAYCNGK